MRTDSKFARILIASLAVSGPCVTGFAALSQDLGALHIESFLTPPRVGAHEDGRQVVVAIRGEGVTTLSAGDVLVSGRTVLDQTAGRVEFSTGQLKVTHVDGARAIATIEVDGAEASASVLGRFNKVMSGDAIRPLARNIHPRLAITGEVSLNYNELFVDPNSGSLTLELSAAGREALSGALKSLGAVRASMVAVQGFTDHGGDAEANQVESYERALTVKRFMIETLGFDSERVQAFGLGEREAVDTSHLAGAADKNRRIVIKVLPQVQTAGF
ncbi:MAG: OmpA family [Pseudomonadota bacterium]|jgi:outer membrane protein OmpA-like peptidoglycan-associated protein